MHAENKSLARGRADAYMLSVVCLSLTRSSSSTLSCIEKETKVLRVMKRVHPRAAPRLNLIQFHAGSLWFCTITGKFGARGVRATPHAENKGPKIVTQREWRAQLLPCVFPLDLLCWDVFFVTQYSRRTSPPLLLFLFVAVVNLSFLLILNWNFVYDTYCGLQLDVALKQTGVVEALVGADHCLLRCRSSMHVPWAVAHGRQRDGRRCRGRHCKIFGDGELFIIFISFT